MKIFVTGATGFIGKNLAKRLADEGHEVIAAGRNLSKLASLKDKVKPVYLDIENKELTASLLKNENPDVVCHSAALVENASLSKLLRVNRDGTENVLEACLRQGVKKVIYVSTVAVVSGNPEVPLTEGLPYKSTNAYGVSKIEAEKIAIRYRNKGLKIAIIRPCIVYGEDESHGFSLLVSALKKRILPIFGNGEVKLHLVFVDNVVDLMVLSLSNENAYEGTFFIADKEVLSVKEIFNFIAKTIGVRPPFVLPGWIAGFLGKLPLMGKYFSIFTKDRIYSIKRIEEKLGYVPRVSVYDGLRRTVLS